MTEGSSAAAPPPIRGEARWPSVAAVFTALVLTVVGPSEVRVTATW